MIDPTSRGDGGAAVLARADVEVEVGILSQEVLTVLRPWLSATRRRRPHVTWAYSLSTGVPDQPDTSLVHVWQTAVDVVVSAEFVQERLPGGHSPRHFDVDRLRPYDDDLDAWLTAAYRAGVRSMLLTGNTRTATALYAADAIDEHLVLTQRLQDSRLPTPTLRRLEEYEILSVTGWGGALLTHLRRVQVLAADNR